MKNQVQLITYADRLGGGDISALHRYRAEAANVPCPRCKSTRTRQQSRYGSTPCKAQYRCDDCLEPFDYFKPH